MIKISIIIPVYNVSEYLPVFLKSLAKQKLSNVEYIFVDDGSTDNSLILCNKFKSKRKNTKVIHQSNKGVSEARNVGLNLAKGKYIYFCDPDDVLNPNLLLDNYRLAERFKTDLVFFGFDIMDSKIKNVLEKVNFNFCFCKTRSKFIKVFPKLDKNINLNCLWNKLYLREKIGNLRFENVRTGEDIRFNIAYYNKISRILINNKIYYYYRSERPGSSQSIKRLDDIFLYFEEKKRLTNLVFNNWRENNNPDYLKMIRSEYTNLIVTILRKAEDLKNYRKQVYFFKKISEYIPNKYFTFNKNNNLKSNYYVLIYKLRYVPFILALDNALHKLKAILKSN